MKRDLTRRELLVARLLSEGYSRDAIATSLSITVDGVRAHIDRIYLKVGGKGKKSLSVATYYIRNHLPIA